MIRLHGNQKVYEPVIKWIEENMLKDGEWNEGEGRVFILNDCCVVVTMGQGVLNIQAIEGDPVKLDHNTGLFEAS